MVFRRRRKPYLVQKRKPSHTPDKKAELFKELCLILAGLIALAGSIVTLVKEMRPKEETRIERPYQSSVPENSNSSPAKVENANQSRSKKRPVRRPRKPKQYGEWSISPDPR